MSFMTLATYNGDYWLVETSIGTELVPCDVARDGDDLAQFVEGSIEGEPERHNGWYGRYSAPGYMDRTDWHWADTEAELLDELEEAYGDDE